MDDAARARGARRGHAAAARRRRRASLDRRRWRGERPRAASSRRRSRRRRAPSASWSARRSGSTGETSGRRSRSASPSRWSTRSCGRHPTGIRSSSPWSEHFLATLSYVVACSIVTEQSLRSRHAVVAYCIGVLVFVPFPLLATLFVLPGLIWLSLFGLAVPVALVEGLGVRGSLIRAVRLARVGLRPRSGRLGHARDRGVSHPGIALLRPPRVRGEHESRGGDAGIDRRVAARVSRGRAPVRRPDRSIRLTPRATKGARCRPT